MLRNSPKLPGIRSLHDFVDNEVIFHVRELCYTGRFKNTAMTLVRGADATSTAIPIACDTYNVTNQSHELSTTELADLKEMYFQIQGVVTTAFAVQPPVTRVTIL